MRYLIALFIFVLGLYGCSGNKPVAVKSPPSFAAPQPPANFAQIQSEIRAYMASHNESAWWLERQVPESQANKKLTDPLRRNITEALNRLGPTTDETKEIAKAFSKFNVGVVISSKMGVGISSDDLSYPGGKVLIVFYPKEDGPLHPAAVWYDASRKVVFVAAVDWPPAVFTSLLGHELSHALQHQRNALGSVASKELDEWVYEEVRAHTVESQILNRLADGAYYKTLDRLLAESKIVDWSEAYRVLTKGHLDELDLILGTKQAGHKVLNPVVAQHLLVVGMRCIELNVPAEDRKRELIDCYRVTTTRFGG